MEELKFRLAMQIKTIAVKVFTDTTAGSFWLIFKCEKFDIRSRQFSKKDIQSLDAFFLIMVTI